MIFWQVFINILVCLLFLFFCLFFQIRVLDTLQFLFHWSHSLVFFCIRNTHSKVHHSTDTQSHIKRAHHLPRRTLQNVVGVFLLPQKVPGVWTEFAGLLDAEVPGLSSAFPQEAEGRSSSLPDRTVSPAAPFLLTPAPAHKLFILFSNSLNPLLHHIVANRSRRQLP